MILLYYTFMIIFNIENQVHRVPCSKAMFVKITEQHYYFCDLKYFQLYYIT